AGEEKIFSLQCAVADAALALAEDLRKQAAVSNQNRLGVIRHRELDVERARPDVAHRPLLHHPAQSESAPDLDLLLHGLRRSYVVVELVLEQRNPPIVN